MQSSDRWLKWSFNLFIFLLFFQFGVLLTLKNLFYQAEQKLKSHEASVSFRCGDFNTEASYWALPESQESLVGLCQDTFCPDSYWKNSEVQDKSLQVVSVKKALPLTQSGERALIDFVDIKVGSSAKPQILTLISQTMMMWNLTVEEQANLEEVIVVGPEVVWVEGLPKEVKLTYFPKEKLCAYPTAWEELANPSNEFRRLFQALKSYSGYAIDSFQGKQLAKSMRVPFRSPLVESHLAEQLALKGDRQPASAQGEPLGLQWSRSDQRLQAKSFHYRQRGETKKVDLPPKVTDAYFEKATGQLFVIQNFRFGTYDSAKKEFSPIHQPLSLPAMYWPLALTFNPFKSEIYIYNDDRGGEILAYNVVTKKWRVFATKTGHSLVALHFLASEQSLLATRLKNRKITDLIKISKAGQVAKILPLEKPLDFSKNHWRADIYGTSQEYWLRLSHPARPEGDLYPLSQVVGAL